MDKGNSSPPAVRQESKISSECTSEPNTCEPAVDMFLGLFEKAPDALLVSNRGGKIICANAQAEKLFGYTQSDMVGSQIEMLMPERFRRSHAEHRSNYALEPAFRAMGPDLNLYGLRKDNTEFPVEISLSPLNTDAGTVFATAIRDVSDRKRMESILESQLAFERTMSQLSATFVNVPTVDVERKISEAMRTIAEELGFDRTCLGEVRLLRQFRNSMFLGPAGNP